MPPEGEGRRRWALPMAVAVIFLLLGVALLAWPEAVIGVFPPLLGVVLLLVGVQGTAHTLVMWRRLPAPGFALLRGLVNLVVGVIFLVRRDVSLVFMSVLFGAYVLVGAALDFVAVIRDRKERPAVWTDLAESLLNLVLGVLLLVSPFTGQALWARVLGLHFVLVVGSSLWWLWRQRQNPADAAEEDGENGAGDERV